MNRCAGNGSEVFAAITQKEVVRTFPVLGSGHEPFYECFVFRDGGDGALTKILEERQGL